MATEIPRVRPAAPSLAVAAAMLAASGAALPLVLTALRFDAAGWQRGDNQRLWTLFTLGASALSLGATVVAAAGALALVRMRRTPGAALAAAAFGASAVALSIQLVATWLWPWAGAARGWRMQIGDIGGWVATAVPLLATVGLCAASWGDRAIRVVAPAAVGAALLAAPPPPLLSWAYSWVEFGAYRWDVELGAYRLVPDARLWIVPSLLAAGWLAWGASTAWLVARQPGVPSDALAPRPPAPCLRRLSVSMLIMPVVGVGAGLVIAMVQGRPADGTGPLGVVIPSAVAAASALVAASLIAVAVTDVSAAAARRCAAAAICVLWLVAVVVAQTLGSQRPEAPPKLFTVFEPPWMPGMAGAVVAALAMINMASALAVMARDAGQPTSRAQTMIVVLALVIGAITTPWVLGFGTRSLPLDALRISTLGSAALVNLAAWIALARSAWRVAASFDDSVVASAP